MTFDKDKLESSQEYDFLFELGCRMNKSMEKVYKLMDEAYDREREAEYERNEK